MTPKVMAPEAAAAVADGVYRLLADVLDTPVAELEEHDPHDPLELTSLQNLSIVARLDGCIGNVSVTLLFDRPSIASIIDYLITERAADVAPLISGSR